jgi:hypothetical protein
MKNNKSRIGSLLAVSTVLAATVASASAQLVVTEATGAITEAITKGTTVIAAGFAIGALFLVARVIRRGMSSAR